MRTLRAAGCTLLAFIRVYCPKSLEQSSAPVLHGLLPCPPLPDMASTACWRRCSTGRPSAWRLELRCFTGVCRGLLGKPAAGFQLIMDYLYGTVVCSFGLLGFPGRASLCLGSGREDFHANYRSAPSFSPWLWGLRASIRCEVRLRG